MKSTTPINEEQQAELLEHYLSGLDAGNAFSISNQVDDPELIELMKFSKDLRVSAQPAALPATIRTQPHEAKRSRLWWLVPVPVIGLGATLSAIFFISQTTQKSNSTIPLTEAERNMVVQELALIDEIDADISTSVNDYDALVADTEALIDEESYDDLQTLFDVSEL